MYLDTITTPSDREMDITDQMSRLFYVFESGDFNAKYNADFIKSFGRKLISVGGVEMPATVIDDYAEDWTPEFCDHLRRIWGAITIQCQDD